MSEKSALNRALISLMVFYALAAVTSILASASMLYHVTPQSKCLLYSHALKNGELSFGNYASCMMVGYVYLGIFLGASFLFVRTWVELRRRADHAPTGEFEKQQVPKIIFGIHIFVACLALLLTLVVTGGYVAACENIRTPERANILQKLNESPYETRGEEFNTRFEDDYKFHRYTNRHANAWGADVYAVSITCRSVLTDPNVHEKLHQTHARTQERYYGYWYGQDIYGIVDSQGEAAKANILIEACLAGCWLNVACWLAGFILMCFQKLNLKKRQEEMDRISVHSNMLGMSHHDGSLANGRSFRRDGSLISGSVNRSNFQRGGSMRGSDRSMRRDVDDIALSAHLGLTGSCHQFPIQPSGSLQPVTGYGRKEIDDMVLNQHINQYQQGAAGSQYSSRETGYVSDGAHEPTISAQFYHPSNYPGAQQSYYPDVQQPVTLPYVPQPTGSSGGPSSAYTKGDSTYMERSEVETEIF